MKCFQLCQIRKKIHDEQKKIELKEQEKKGSGPIFRQPQSQPLPSQENFEEGAVFVCCSFVLCFMFLIESSLHRSLAFEIIFFAGSWGAGRTRF